MTQERGKEIIEKNIKRLYRIPKKYKNINLLFEKNSNLRTDLLNILNFALQVQLIFYKKRYCIHLPTTVLKKILGYKINGTISKHINYLATAGFIGKQYQNEKTDNVTDINLAFCIQNKNKYHMNLFYIRNYDTKTLKEIDEKVGCLLNDGITVGNISKKILEINSVSQADKIYYRTSTQSLAKDREVFDLILSKIQESCTTRGYAKKEEIRLQCKLGKIKFNKLMTLFKKEFTSKFSYKRPTEEEKVKYKLVDSSYIITERKKKMKRKKNELSRYEYQKRYNEDLENGTIKREEGEIFEPCYKSTDKARKRLPKYWYVSNHARVYTAKQRKMLKIQYTPDGRPYIIYKEKTENEVKNHNIYVYWLVAVCFKGAIITPEARKIIDKTGFIGWAEAGIEVHHVKGSHDNSPKNLILGTKQIHKKVLHNKPAETLEEFNKIRPILQKEFEGSKEPHLVFPADSNDKGFIRKIEKNNKDSDKKDDTKNVYWSETAVNQLGQITQDLLVRQAIIENHPNFNELDPDVKQNLVETYTKILNER